MYFTVVSLPQISQSIGLTNLQQTHKEAYWQTKCI